MIAARSRSQQKRKNKSLVNNSAGFRKIRHIIQVRAGRFILIALLILLGGLTGYYSYTIGFWNIDIIEVNYNSKNKFTKSKILNSANQEIKNKNIFTTNLSDFTNTIIEEPFIRDVYIEKRLPNKIIIYIDEAEPQFYFLDINQISLIDENGKILESYSLPEKFDISEEERLIVTEDLPFKSNILRSKWLAEVQPELEEEFLDNWDEILENLINESSSNTDEINETKRKQIEDYQNEKELFNNQESNSQEDSVFDPTGTKLYKEEFLEFIDNKYREAPLESLTGIYNQLRAEIRSTIEPRWEELLAEVELIPNIEIVRSLVNIDQLYAREEVFQSTYTDIIAEFSEQGYTIESLTQLGPQVLSIELKDADLLANNLTILVNTRKDIGLTFSIFENMLLELSNDDQQYTQIDLVGERVIVR